MNEEDKIQRKEELRSMSNDVVDRLYNFIVNATDGKYYSMMGDVVEAAKIVIDYDYCH